MKIINVGLSVLITMGLAISPIHANEFDATDESNEQSVVNNDDTSSNEEVDSNSETVQVQSISVSTDDNTTEYSLDENEVKNIKLVVTKIFTDGILNRLLIINMIFMVLLVICIFLMRVDHFKIM